MEMNNPRHTANEKQKGIAMSKKKYPRTLFDDMMVMSILWTGRLMSFRIDRISFGIEGPEGVAE